MRVRQWPAACASAWISWLSPVATGSAMPLSFQSIVAEEPSNRPRDTSLVPALSKPV